jgi:hypothetical protein
LRVTTPLRMQSPTRISVFILLYLWNGKLLKVPWAGEGTEYHLI